MIERIEDLGARHWELLLELEARLFMKAHLQVFAANNTEDFLDLEAGKLVSLADPAGPQLTDLGWFIAHTLRQWRARFNYDFNLFGLRQTGELKATPERKGLYTKYLVFKREDGSRVENCFVLKPASDPAAREAMLRYIAITSDKELAQGITEWMTTLGFSHGM